MVARRNRLARGEHVTAKKHTPTLLYFFTTTGASTHVSPPFAAALIRSAVDSPVDPEPCRPSLPPSADVDASALPTPVAEIAPLADPPSSPGVAPPDTSPAALAFPFSPRGAPFSSLSPAPPSPVPVPLPRLSVVSCTETADMPFANIAISLISI